MDINTRYLQIIGKVEIPEDLIMGENYELLIKGTMISEKKDDNHNGTYDKGFKIKPILLSLIDEKGKTIKAKDSRRNGEKIRSQIYAIWADKNINVDFDIFYDAVCAKYRNLATAIAEDLIKTKKWQ